MTKMRSHFHFVVSHDDGTQKLSDLRAFHIFGLGTFNLYMVFPFHVFLYRDVKLRAKSLDAGFLGSNPGSNTY